MSSLYEPLVDNFYFWDFIVEGRSFVYNQVRSIHSQVISLQHVYSMDFNLFSYLQVRRMVSAALGVAQGKCTVADVRRFLHSPPPSPPHLHVVPAHGLYLMKVTYDEMFLAIDRKRYNTGSEEHVQLLHMLDQYKFSLENSI